MSRLLGIFTSEFVYMWIRVVTPILLPALGSAICSKAGVLNLGLEGIMLMSALAGALGSALGGGLLWGLAAGLAVSLLISLVFACFHLNLKADATLCGTAINAFATGATVMVLFLFTHEKGSSASLKSFSFPAVRIPLLADIPILGDILSGHNFLTYLAFICTALVYILLYKTPLGLRIRAAGEKPEAAESVGVSVIRVRYLAILMCGVLAAFGGMYMSMGYLGFFTRDMIAGRGFIALAASAMGNATPLGAMLSSLMFAFFDGLSNSMQSLNIPHEFIQMIPYVATIVGLLAFSIQKERAHERRKRLKAASVGGDCAEAGSPPGIASGTPKEACEISANGIGAGKDTDMKDEGGTGSCFGVAKR